LSRSQTDWFTQWDKEEEWELTTRLAYRNGFTSRYISPFAILTMPEHGQHDDVTEELLMVESKARSTTRLRFPRLGCHCGHSCGDPRHADRGEIERKPI
jgi:hypothetical protein